MIAYASRVAPPVPDHAVIRQTELGCLALADISGYTSYLAGAELDHAQDVLEDLTETVVRSLSPPMKLSKVEGDAVFVYAPFDAVGVEQQLSELVEGALRERGLQRADEGAELRVAALLVGTRHIEAIRRARAMRTLYSHHDIGGYEVEGDDVERRPVDRCRLAIYVTGSQQEKMVWQAVSEQKHTGGCAPHLDATVANLLASFPPPPPDDG